MAVQERQDIKVQVRAAFENGVGNSTVEQGALRVVLRAYCLENEQGSSVSIGLHRRLDDW
jgi:hypothetical protein